MGLESMEWIYVAQVRTLTKLRFVCSAHYIVMSAHYIVMKPQISSDMQISCLDSPNPPPHTHKKIRKTYRQWLLAG